MIVTVTSYLAIFACVYRAPVTGVVFASRKLNRAASRKGPSITEVSFEVLVGGEAGRDFDASEFDEFVDHCKAFAAQLSEEQKRCAAPPCFGPEMHVVGRS